MVHGPFYFVTEVSPFISTMSKTTKNSPAAKSPKSKKQKLDLPVLTDEEKRVIMIQYEKENDADDAEALLAEYLKFMHIKIKEQDTNERAAPSKMIDEMWHAHILSTKEYFAFCERHSSSGEYIHHDPSMTDVPRRYRMTWQRYEELFGSSPKDQSIWPYPEPEPYEEESDEGSYDDFGCG